MDWIYWFLEPSLHAPIIDSSTLDGKPLPTDVDVQLTELVYLFIANEQSCSECGHLLGRGLRVRTSFPPLGRWPLRVDTRCWGWRRHRHVAAITRPSKDLLFGALQLKVP